VCPQVIVFDLDGTLRHNQPPSLHTFIDHAVRLGVPDGGEKRRRAARWTHYYWAQSDELLEDVQEFVEMDEPFWTHYARRSLLALDCSPDCAHELAPQMVRHMDTTYQPEDIILPDVPETLGALQRAGYRLAVLSNRSQPCDEYLEEIGLAGYFETALVAGQVGSWKPDPGIFRHILAHMGAAAGDTLYVGDNYYADVVGAQRAGVQPLLLDPEQVFPDAECPVIEAIGDLAALARLCS